MIFEILYTDRQNFYNYYQTEKSCRIYNFFLFVKIINACQNKKNDRIVIYKIKEKKKRKSFNKYK